TLPEFVCMYLPFCLLGNCLSIFAPMPIRGGCFKPMNPKALPVLLHIATALLSPLVLVPALAPLGVELLVEELAGRGWVPVCLILSLLECVAMIFLYRLVVGWQGELLQARERKILEVVTARAE